MNQRANERRASVDDAAVQGLSALVRGQILRASDADYDRARAVYNAMADRRPAVIVRCVDTADVIAGVNFARENGLLLAVRGGGHNVNGFGVCDAGVVLDLSRMRSVRVDPARRTARVEGGATWGDVDHATHAYGLATPAGIISTTGVAGLTLGGGFGHLTRRYGLTCDNLLSADVVTADGRVLTASEDENADLFWALRGGGGNFGVVTSFEFQLHPVSTVVAGVMFYPVARAGDVLRMYRDFMNAAPTELSAFFGFQIAPPAPFIPPEIQGQTMALIVPCHTGSPERAEADLRPLRKVVPPAFEHVGPMPYPVLNSTFDALLHPGLYHYWKGDFVRELKDEAIDVHVQYGPRVPTVQSTMHIYPLDGAVHRVANNATAFHHRDVKFTHVIVGVDEKPGPMKERIGWVREYWNALHPHSEQGTYVNFLGDEGDDRIRATYGESYGRLAAIKHKYDPGNLFRLNQNIKPAAGAIPDITAPAGARKGDGHPGATTAKPSPTARPPRRTP